MEERAVSALLPHQPHPTVSIIVTVHNEKLLLHRCLDSITAAAPPSSEVIVVADGDTDGSWHVATQYSTQVFRLQTHRGIAAARNYGAREAHGDILFFVNANVTIPPDAVSQVVTAFARNPNLTALFASVDDAPLPENFHFQYKLLLQHYFHQTARNDTPPFWAVCGVIRRDAFLAVGGFDEHDRHPAIQDLQLGYRLKRAGYHIHLSKTLQVKEKRRWTARTALYDDFCARALPYAILLVRGHGLLHVLHSRPSACVSLLGLYSLLAAPFTAYLWSALPLLLPTLLTINAPLYRFLWRKRGAQFALRAIPWHWLSYCAYAFALVWVIPYLLFRKRKPPPSLPASTSS